MEILKSSASALSAKVYTIHSPYTDYISLFRDAPREQAWETFGTPSLPVYFSRGMDKFCETLDEFSDLSKPLSPGIEKQLPFMLESLLYVRKLIEETESTAKVN